MENLEICIYLYKETEREPKKGESYYPNNETGKKRQADAIAALSSMLLRLPYISRSIDISKCRKRKRREEYSEISKCLYLYGMVMGEWVGGPGT